MTKFNIEKITIYLIGISFFIGVWHAFPMLNVVNDEMYYVGGVLRAMENYTVIPAINDVPYGTVTYLVNYVFSVFTILLLFPFVGFSVVSLKSYLVMSPSIMYLTLRLTSSISALIILYFINRVLKKEFEDYRVRLFILVLLFTNIITTVILHTGKMWVISTLLVIISFYYLYRSINEDNAHPKNDIFLSIIFSFLAVSNFPLNFYALLAIPILLYYFRKDKDIIKKIIVYSVVGFAVYALITLLNFQGIKNQIISIFSEYHPIIGDETVKLNFFKSFSVYITKVVLLFPLLLISIGLYVKDGVRNKKLLIISSVYFVVYFLIITIVANWATDLNSALRYLFPLGFFLTFIFSSLDIKFKKVLYPIGVVSIVFYLFTLYYLSTPTTYNIAYDWTNENLKTKNVVIINEVLELQLTKNKESAVLTKEEFCASKCKAIISSNLNSDFKPLVLDSSSREYDLLERKDVVYYIKDSMTNETRMELVKSIEGDSENYYSVDYNTGNYFGISYLKFNSFGKNIYIYELNK